MHHGEQIVWRVEVVEPHRIDRFEVVSHLRPNVVPEDLHKLIALDVIVHVVIAESVDRFVDHYSVPNAPVSRHRHLLSAAHSSEPRPASIGVYNLNEINFISSFNKPNASLTFDDSELHSHPIDLMRHW